MDRPWNHYWPLRDEDPVLICTYIELEETPSKEELRRFYKFVADNAPYFFSGNVVNGQQTLNRDPK